MPMDDSDVEKEDAIDTPFPVLMQQAVKLKSAQQAVLRNRYDSYSKIYQHSMFANDKVIEDRKLPFPKRYQSAVQRKELGNELFKDGKYIEASTQYEQAVSIFVFLENRNENWKREGINDDDLNCKEYVGINDDEKESIRNLRISCYLNSALCYYHRAEFLDAIECCNEALEVDPQCIKALHRRALIRITPKSAGATEQDLAIRDLQKACLLAPADQMIRKELGRLQSLRRLQREKDKRTFEGMFSRGEIYKELDQKISDRSLSAMKASTDKGPESLASTARDMLQLADVYQAEGRHTEANHLRMKVKEARKMYKKACSKTINLEKPSRATIKDAKRFGIDLTDETVRDCLKTIQKEAREGKIDVEKFRSGERLTPEDLTPGILEGLVKQMSDEDLHEALRECGIENDLTNYQRKDLENLLIEGYCHRHTLSENPIVKDMIKDKKTSGKNTVFRITFIVSFVVFLLRLYFLYNRSVS